MKDTPQDQDFAASAKKTAEGQQTLYYDNAQLDAETQKIVAAVTGAPEDKGPPVKQQLADSLWIIKTQQLYLAERDVDGTPLIPSFERFVKKLRPVFVKATDGHIGDAYKLVAEAVLYNKLRECQARVMPTSRSQLQKLGTVDGEGQFKVWEHTVEVTGSKDITPRDIAMAARALGYEEVTLPPPTASSRMSQIREEWSVFKNATTHTFGPTIVPYFKNLDNMLAPKRPEKKPGAEANTKIESTDTESAAPDTPEPSQVTGQSGMGKDGGGNNGTTAQIVETSSLENVLARMLANSATNVDTGETTQKDASSGSPPITPESNNPPELTPPSEAVSPIAPSNSTHNTVGDDTPEVDGANPPATKSSVTPDALLSARVWKDETGVMIGFKSARHKQAVAAKIPFFHLGYRWDDSTRSWRRRFHDEGSRDKELNDIMAKFRDSGVEVQAA